jgi:hypothetical protein
MGGADGPWARLPQSPRVRHGVHLKDERGQPLWNAPIVRQSRQLSNEFSTAVVTALRHKFPQALE